MPLRTRVATVLLAGLLSLSACASDDVESSDDISWEVIEPSESYPLDTCPVSGKPLDEGAGVSWSGRRGTHGYTEPRPRCDASTGSDSPARPAVNRVGARLLRRPAGRKTATAFATPAGAAVTTTAQRNASWPAVFASAALT